MTTLKLSLIASLLILTTFTACGTGPELTPEMQKEVKRFDDVTKLKELEQNIHQAMNQDELLFYAPISINQAKSYYEDAVEDDLKDEKMIDYLHAKKALKHAYETKELVKKYLADVADIERRMQIQNTKEIFPDRYEDFQDDYKDLIKTIDKGEISDALEDKKDVMEDAKDLYGDAVVYRNINKAKMILEQMDDDNLDDLAPHQYKKAQNLYKEVRLKIKKEPDDHAMIKNLAKETNESALYAQTLAKDVFNFRALNKDEQEAYFAKLHRELAKLNPNELENAILPLPLYEKINYLQDICTISHHQK
jgi:hypothetical protein